MNKFCIKINLNIPLFKNKLYLYSLKTKSHSIVDLNEISNDVHLLFDKLGLQITFIESFFKIPFQPNGIHKDAPGYNDATKINWVFGGGDSLMNWYASKNNAVIEQQNVNSVGVQYAYFKKDDLDLIHSQVVESPSIVQVGIPHNITVGSSHRHCISAFFKYKKNNTYVTFNESIDLFKNYKDMLVDCSRVELLTK